VTKHLTHWIGGKPWDGEAGRHGDIYDPATGQVSGQVDFAAPAEGRAHAELCCAVAKMQAALGEAGGMRQQACHGVAVAFRILKPLPKNHVAAALAVDATARCELAEADLEVICGSEPACVQFRIAAGKPAGVAM